MVRHLFVPFVQILDRITRSFDGGLPHCKRCGCEIERGALVCPQCGFDPRDRGLRVATSLLMSVVLLVLLAVVSIFALPAVGRYLLFLALASFLLALLLFLVSFVATPYRLGRLFTIRTNRK